MNKQETLQEAAEKLAKESFSVTFKKFPYGGKLSNEVIIEALTIFFKEGAKWQQERSYSEEEVLEILCKSHNAENTSIKANMFNKWFENFKKK
jgi:hypothetical protein